MTRTNYLEGHLLLAMPSIGDPRFDHSVIYICSQGDDGAMGLVINAPASNIEFSDFLDQLDVSYDAEKLSGASAPGKEIILHAGGPVEVGRGFILHSADYVQESTMIISETVALTATLDILTAIAEDRGPANFLVALGYTGWNRNQLEEELNRNSWLSIEADEELLFRTELDLKWPRAMAKLGVDVTMLSTFTGNA